ncbi:hypothetical protein FXO38_06864 [Capsicum annuum]|nr:hypothetical protein FXO38_06864 [Capsicum annuum]
MTNCLCKPLIQGLVELRLFSLVFISLLIQLEIGSYVERVTSFKKALLGPRFLKDERLKKKSSPSTDEEKKEMSLVPYSYTVGSLIYAMVCTRPDIARYWHSRKDEYVPSLYWLSYQLAARVPETNRELSQKKSKGGLITESVLVLGSRLLSFAESGIADSRAARRLVFFFLLRPAIPAESSLRLDGRITVDSDRRRSIQSGLSMKGGCSGDRVQAHYSTAGKERKSISYRGGTFSHKCEFSATLHSLRRHDRGNLQCPDKRRDQLIDSITESSRKSGKHHKDGLLVRVLRLDVYARYRFPQLAHRSRLQDL